MQNQPTEAPDFSEDKDDIDEEGEEDFFVDEEFGEEDGERKSRPGSCLIARTITLQMLLADHLLQPGEGAMSIEYMGQRFIGDLLADGKIRSQETDIVFATPSAWAVNCKRIINPIKRSGCGWASVRYKGRKLDAYKNIWINRRNEERKKLNTEVDVGNLSSEKDSAMLAPPPVTVPAPLPPPPPPPPPPPAPPTRVPVKHHTIGSRTSLHDPNMLVESTSFSTLGKIQPFLVSMSTNAVLIMDYHCHLTTSEVCGYLGGNWDVNAHNLSVTNVFPCRARLDDKINGPLVEKEIRKDIENRGLIPVGWYHSHPMFPASPSLRDIDKQLDHEMHMKGSSDSSYTPCVGVICSPYFNEATIMESSIISYWVAPPPENKPLEYGKPMLMSYSVVQDPHLTHDVLKELTALAEFYKEQADFIDFTKLYKNDVTYLEKLKATLLPKFPKDQTDGILWGFIRQLVTPGSEECDDDGNVIVYKPEVATVTSSSSSTPTTSASATTLVVPLLQLGNRTSSTTTTVSASSVSTTTGSPSSSSSVYVGADMASAIIAAGKLPAGTSLMSVLPGNSQNMFLSPMSLNLLSNNGSNSSCSNIKGNKSNAMSSSSIASLAAISSLSNLGGLGNLGIANLANLNNLTLSSLGNLNNLANISLSNKNTISTTNLTSGGLRNNPNFTLSSLNPSLSSMSTASVTSTSTLGLPSVSTSTKVSTLCPKEESSALETISDCETISVPENLVSGDNSSSIPSTLKGIKSSTFTSSNGPEGEGLNNHCFETPHIESDLERPAKLPKVDSVTR